MDYTFKRMASGSVYKDLSGVSSGRLLDIPENLKRKYIKIVYHIFANTPDLFIKFGADFTADEIALIDSEGFGTTANTDIFYLKAPVTRSIIYEDKNADGYECYKGAIHIYCGTGKVNVSWFYDNIESD